MKWNDIASLTILQSSLGMFPFCLKWDVTELLAMCHCRNMVFFSFSSHFSPLLAKIEWFWGWCWSLEFSKFQYARDMCRFWLKWGFNQLLTIWRCRDMAFFCIFSHFSIFLAKNDWFWGQYWSLESSIFPSAIEMSWFWLKWGVNQLLTMCRCRDMAFFCIFSHFSPFLAKNGWFLGR